VSPLSWLHSAKIEKVLIYTAGALSIEYLKRIVVDASHIDQKKRGVLDMKDTMLPLARWLTRPELKERYAAEEKPLDLLFF
jgi:protein CMS1